MYRVLALRDARRKELLFGGPLLLRRPRKAQHGRRPYSVPGTRGLAQPPQQPPQQPQQQPPPGRRILLNPFSVQPRRRTRIVFSTTAPSAAANRPMSSLDPALMERLDVTASRERNAARAQLLGETTDWSFGTYTRPRTVSESSSVSVASVLDAQQREQQNAALRERLMRPLRPYRPPEPPPQPRAPLSDQVTGDFRPPPADQDGRFRRRDIDIDYYDFRYDLNDERVYQQVLRDYDRAYEAQRQQGNERVMQGQPLGTDLRILLYGKPIVNGRVPIERYVQLLREERERENERQYNEMLRRANAEFGESQSAPPSVRGSPRALSPIDDVSDTLSPTLGAVGGAPADLPRDVLTQADRETMERLVNANLAGAQGTFVDRVARDTLDFDPLSNAATAAAAVTSPTSASAPGSPDRRRDDDQEEAVLTTSSNVELLEDEDDDDDRDTNRDRQDPDRPVEQEEEERRREEEEEEEDDDGVVEMAMDTTLEEFDPLFNRPRTSGRRGRRGASNAVLTYRANKGKKK